MKIFATLLAMLVSAFATANSRLTIYTEEFMPYNYTENGFATGINTDITRKLCELANVRCRFQTYPWKRAYRYAQDDDLSGLVSTAKLPDRINDFQWVGPLISGKTCLYKLNARDDIPKITRDNMFNYKLGISKDSVYKDLFVDIGYVPNESLIMYNSKAGMLRSFKVGRVDVLIGSANSLHTRMKSIDVSINDVEPVYIISEMDQYGNHLALNRRVPKDIVDRLNDALEQLKSENYLEQVKQQYVKASNLVSREGVDQTLWNECMPDS